jgi:Na+-translocating ferredoxin:NAD+ oxidoreductase subunit D
MPFVVSPSPHLHKKENTTSIMGDVIIALIPASIASTYFFGLSALSTILVSILAAVLSELVTQIIFKKKILIFDLSAVVTGLLLALTLPPNIPLWAVALASVFSIVVAKEFFGGIGCNIFNPALIGRAFLLASYPVMMTTWTKPFDAVTGPTPLGLLQKASEAGTLASSFFESIPLTDLFWGNIAGSLGETSAFCLLLGAAYLLYKRVIGITIPASYIITFALLTLISGQPVVWHLFAGGLILGAFFMATDYATSPMTFWGQIIFGIGIGVFTFIIRFYGGYPEGVCYAILLMNITVPLLDRIGARK